MKGRNLNRLRKFARHIFSRTDPAQYHAVLERYNPYYRALNTDGKGRFLRRTDEFLNAVDFSSEPGFNIRPEMQVIIASAFIQITFGLKEYLLTTYDRIFIAPQSYTYPGFRKLLSGDVNTDLRLISLSWPSVVKGFEIEHDALNIAIHEFGHCLTIENFSRPYLELYFSESDWMQWVDSARDLLDSVQAGSHKVIRRYGGTNIMELFAVSLENFFERPGFMKDHLPEMYASLVAMLNQDPLRGADPVIKR